MLYNHILVSFIPKMINAKIHNGRVMISSIELYDAIGRPRMKYYRWLERHTNENSVKSPMDYCFVREPNTKRHRPMVVYFSLTLAKAICIYEKSRVAMKIREYIEMHIDPIDPKIKI